MMRGLLVVWQSVAAALPQTYAQWFTFALSLLALMGTGVAWGRVLERLNGYGSVQVEVKKDIARDRGIIDTLMQVVRDVQSTQAVLLEKIAESKAAQGACREDMERYAINVGTNVDASRREVLAKVDSIGEKMTNLDKDLSARLVGLEREVRVRFDTPRGGTA